MSIFPALQTLVENFRSRAQDLDRGATPPRDNLQGLAEIGYFRFVTTAKPGERRRALDLLSSGCGVTAFLATQHEGVCRRLHQAEHPLLDTAVEGKPWIGVCFAHLRRDPSPVIAIENRDHVVFSGRGPWFTGHKVMDRVMVGGATPGGRFLMGLAPMDSPEIVPAPLPALAVMEATATVGLDFNALRVDTPDIIVNITPEELTEKDMHSTVYQGGRSLGVVRATAEFLPESARTALLQKVEELHQAMDRWDLQPDWSSASTLRRECLELAQRSIQAAFMVVGGKAHLLSHPLHRLAREASFYSTTQLTQQLRSSVVEALLPQKQAL